MKYKIKWNYKSSYGGPWMKGDVVELSDTQAEEIDRDSPGVLEAVIEKISKGKNRMVVEPENSRAEEDEQEPITEEIFQAVRKNK